MKHFLVLAMVFSLISDLSSSQMKTATDYPNAIKFLAAAVCDYKISVNSRDGELIASMEVPKGVYVIVYADSERTLVADRHQFSGRILIGTKSASDMTKPETTDEMIPGSTKLQFSNAVVTVTAVNK